MEKINIKVLLADIRFWIILFFLIRLIGITNPPLEISHNWRQTTVTMVSRNFLEVDNNIFYPRLDIAGEKSGITGMEFPVFNYLSYIVSEVFGWQHWYGRLINLIVSSFGIWFFYLLVKRYFKKEVALYASLVLLSSIWFQFSRKIMPDTFSMSLVIMALYFGSNYLSKTKEKAYIHLLFSFLFLMLGTLSKLPSGYILACVPLLLAQPAALQKKIVFSAVTLLAFIPCLVWYFYWVPHLVETYDFWHFFMGKSISQGLSEVVNDIPQAMSRFYEIAIKVLGFLVFCFGLGYAIFKKEKKVTLLFTLAFASFLVIMIKAGDTFLHHDYYIIPFVPVMALIAGYGLHQVASRHQVWGIILLSGIMLEGVINQYQDFIIKPEYGSIENLANDLDKVSAKDDLILVNSGQYPTPMYFANRKGWIATNDQLSSNIYIDSLTSLGLKKIVVLKVAFGEEIILPEKALVFENDSYLIYDVMPSY